MLSKTVKFTTESGYEIQPEKKVIRLKGNEERLNTMFFEIKELFTNDGEFREWFSPLDIIAIPSHSTGWRLNKEWRIK